MTFKRSLLALLLFSLGQFVSWSAPPTTAERELFAQTKSRAETGDAAAQLQLASFYAHGTGVAFDPSKAAKWHRKAADQGLARAQYQLAQDYASGFGVKPSAAEEFTWFKRAAEQGLPEAQSALGLCYLNGKGVYDNGVEAVKWFRKAAANGSLRAEYELGLCYFEGTGVTKDITEGLKWIRSAAEQGFPAAQNRLGLCCEKAQGIAKDDVEAYKWYALAAAQDNEHALDIRVGMARLEAIMSEDQILQAQRLAREFKPHVTPSPLPSSVASNPPLESPVNSAAVPRTGFVNVTADNPGSEVFADGSFVGNPPARLKLVEGQHTIEVKNPGCKDYRKQITVGPDADLTLKVILEKL